MTTRNEYISTLEQRLENSDELIKTFKLRRRDATGGLADDYERVIVTLEENRSAALSKLRELRDSSEEDWESLRESAEHLWRDITNTLEQTRDAFLEGLKDDKK